MAGYPERDRPFTLSVDESGVVRLTWAPGTRIDGPLARTAMEAVDDLNADLRRPLLVDMMGVGINREARLAFTREFSAPRLALLGGTPVDRVVANFALSVSRGMATLIRFFSSEADAVAWLSGDRSG